jgi:hypothetical protein
VNCARWDLCGGHRVTGIPTAILDPLLPLVLMKADVPEPLGGHSARQSWRHCSLMSPDLGPVIAPGTLLRPLDCSLRC